MGTKLDRYVAAVGVVPKMHYYCFLVLGCSFAIQLLGASFCLCFAGLSCSLLYFYLRCAFFVFQWVKGSLFFGDVQGVNNVIVAKSS